MWQAPHCTAPPSSISLPEKSLVMLGTRLPGVMATNVVGFPVAHPVPHLCAPATTASPLVGAAASHCFAPSHSAGLTFDPAACGGIGAMPKAGCVFKPVVPWFAEAGFLTSSSSQQQQQPTYGLSHLLTPHAVKRKALVSGEPTEVPCKMRISEEKMTSQLEGLTISNIIDRSNIPFDAEDKACINKSWRKFEELEQRLAAEEASDLNLDVARGDATVRAGTDEEVRRLELAPELRDRLSSTSSMQAAMQVKKPHHAMALVLWKAPESLVPSEDLSSDTNVDKHVKSKDEEKKNELQKSISGSQVPISPIRIDDSDTQWNAEQEVVVDADESVDADEPIDAEDSMMELW